MGSTTLSLDCGQLHNDRFHCCCCCPVCLIITQALGSNTLSELRDAISCPTDKLAEGLGASHPAAYFYIDRCFYDDTRVAPATECSEASCWEVMCCCDRQ